MLCISYIPRAAAGHLRALPVRGVGHYPIPGFLTDTWFLTRNTNMEDFIGKDQQLVTDGLVRQGLDKNNCGGF